MKTVRTSEMKTSETHQLLPLQPQKLPKKLLTSVKNDDD